MHEKKSKKTEPIVIGAGADEEIKKTRKAGVLVWESVPDDFPVAKATAAWEQKNEGWKVKEVVGAQLYIEKLSLGKQSKYWQFVIMTAGPRNEQGQSKGRFFVA